jgi:hypothetical protein
MTLLNDLTCLKENKLKAKNLKERLKIVSGRAFQKLNQSSFPLSLSCIC